MSKHCCKSNCNSLGNMKPWLIRQGHVKVFDMLLEARMVDKVCSEERYCRSGCFVLCGPT